MSLGKGQSSVEVMISVIFILFILLVIAGFALQRTNEGNALKTQTDAQRICGSFAANINTIAEEGHGFYRYFSLPGTLYNQEEYNITVYGNWAELTYGEHNHIEHLVSSNITIHCLDKGEDRKNKAFNTIDGISITCHRPELIFIAGSMRPIKVPAGQDMNITLTVMNFGPVDSGPFILLYNNTHNISVAGLLPEEKLRVSMNMTAPTTPGIYPLEFLLDPLGEVNESIETNNRYDGTLQVF